MIDNTINDDETIVGGGEGMKGCMDRHMTCGVGASWRCDDK